MLLFENAGYNALLPNYHEDLSKSAQTSELGRDRIVRRI